MRAALLVIMLVLLGCLSTQKQVKSQKWVGEDLYRAKCSVCHRPYDPKAYTYEKLQEYVKKYGGVMTDAELQALSDYLQSVTKA